MGIPGENGGMPPNLTLAGQARMPATGYNGVNSPGLFFRAEMSAGLRLAQTEE